MKYTFILIIVPVLSFCQKKDEATEEVYKKFNSELSKNVKQCSCGKTNNALYRISIDDLKDQNRMMEIIGKPDTAYVETVMVACTSFVYKCESEFVSFHFNENNRCIGKSFGQIENGKYIIGGSSIVFGEGTK